MIRLPRRMTGGPDPEPWVRPSPAAARAVGSAVRLAAALAALYALLHLP